jgi:agmatine/peptidylarginine deiminase
MAQDVDLYVTVNDCRHMHKAERDFADLGIDPNRVHFIISRQGTGYYLTRDWGPFAMFDDCGNYGLVDGKYRSYTLSGPHNRLFFPLGRLLNYRPDDRAPRNVALTLDCPRMELPLALTGGNLEFDGHGTCFATQIMLEENKKRGISRDKFIDLMNQEMGVSRLNLVPNFEAYGIQHVDCLMKLLDEERILVKKVPTNHPAFRRVEAIAEELAHTTNVYGRPYQVLRIDTPRYLLNKLASYTNSVIVNRRIYVPLFGIPEDCTALETWREAMPGYEVLGFKYEHWSYTDALHCRVRGVWDPGMLYLTHRRMDAVVPRAKKFTLDVCIQDYSREGLIDEELFLAWRTKGNCQWNRVPLLPAGEGHHYQATIEGIQAGECVEYYFSAASRSGRQETLPRTAPLGYYSFLIE